MPSCCHGLRSIIGSNQGGTAGKYRGGGEPCGATLMRLDLNSARDTVGVGNFDLFLMGMGQFSKSVEHRVPSRGCQFIHIGRSQIRGLDRRQDYSQMIN
jgi:hypothetical protein